MNAIVSIETLTPATVFVPGGVEAIISKVEAEVRATERDISTPEGREAVKSLAYKVARSKTALDDMGKELVAGIKAQAAAIDAERRTIRDRLDALKEEVRGPLTAWETREAERTSGHEQALCLVIEAARFAVPPTAEVIRSRLAEVAELAALDWEEFKERADVAVTESLHTLNDALAAAEQYERDQAELAELRRLKAEREEADRRIAVETEARQRREKAEAEAAAHAEREKVAAEQRAKDLAERIEREKAEAAAEAVRKENQRVADAHAKAEADRLKRENNARLRKKVHGEIAAVLLTCDISEGTAGAIVELIAAGRIPHVSITY